MTLAVKKSTQPGTAIPNTKIYPDKKLRTASIMLLNSTGASGILLTASSSSNYKFYRGDMIKVEFIIYCAMQASGIRDGNSRL